MFEHPTWHRPTDPDGAFVDGPYVAHPFAVDEPTTSGPLAHVRIAVKDNIDIVGRITGSGNPTIAARTSIAERTAPAVDRLLRAGADLVGRTVADELAYSLTGTNKHLGTPRNTRAPDRVCGGSSSGSASAVAAGVVDLGVGTDTGGSIRVPASYCGLVGWRPTYGAVDLDGVVPLAPSFDTIGLLAGRAHVSTLLIAAKLWGFEPTGSLISGLLLVDDLLDLVSVGDRIAIGHRAAALAQTLGVRVRHEALGVDLGSTRDAFQTLQGAEAWAAHAELIRSGQPDLADDIAARFDAAATVSAREVARARVEQASTLERIETLVEDGWIIVQPAADGPPPLTSASPQTYARARRTSLTLGAPAGLAGLPVVVTPVRDDAHPIGLALIGRRHSDHDLINFSMH